MLCACNKLSNIFSSHVCFTKNRNETKFPFNKKLCKMFVFVDKPEELLGKSWEKRQFNSLTLQAFSETYSVYVYQFWLICRINCCLWENQVLLRNFFAKFVFALLDAKWWKMLWKFKFRQVVILFRKGLRACSYKPKFGIWLYGFVQLHL